MFSFIQISVSYLYHRSYETKNDENLVVDKVTGGDQDGSRYKFF